MADFMGSSLVYILALVVTLGVLIAFHEFGHFWVARRLGVKVLRYSIGFGKPLWLRRGRVDNTEYSIAAVPLGGYVRMLDEREGPVPPAEQHRAFNRQTVWTRIAIVAAGPLANFLFAIVAFALIYMVGVNSVRPLLSTPLPDSIAERAGFQDRDLILAVDGKTTETLNTALLELVDRAAAGGEIPILVRDDAGTERVRVLALGQGSDLTTDGQVLRNLGLVPWQPSYPAVIDQLIAGGAAERAGLRPGDEIVTVEGRPVASWLDWAETVRAKPGQNLAIEIERDGVRQALTLTPEKVVANGSEIGRVGAYARVPEEESLGDSENRVLVRFGPVEALVQGAIKTWDMSWFTLRMLGRMVIGQVSIENISGPITIAQFAGESAMIGFTAFISFMALVSISLGVLNLLPVPLLDGGHLLYYLIEIVKGSPVSEDAQYVGQRVGLALIVLLMGLALFNDFSRLLG